MRARGELTAVGLVLALLLLACTSGDPGASVDAPAGADDAAGASSGTDGEGEGDGAEAAASDGAASSPAPGVTEDTIKIGALHVDTEPLAAIGMVFDFGDHAAVYQALADDINANGGIAGRQIELIPVGFDPTSTTPGEAECVQLTEDEDVFLVTGLFLGDAVLCPLEAHPTAVIGGSMTPARLERAEAPWLTWLPDTDEPLDALERFAERGDLDGSVGVFGAVSSQETLEGTVVPALEEMGVEVAEVGIMDAPPSDTVAVNDGVRLIAERFEASGVDTVVLVGAAASNWPQVMADDPSYRPTLRFLSVAAANAFADNGATTDTSILDGSLAGGGYGPDQARYEEEQMQQCLAALAEAGIETPAPDETPADDPQNQPYQAAFQACPDMALVEAWLEAAADDLSYEGLEAAIADLELSLPGDPTVRRYGPPPAGDGDPEVYLYRWDQSLPGFVIED